MVSECLDNCTCSTFVGCTLLNLMQEWVNVLYMPGLRMVVYYETLQTIWICHLVIHEKLDLDNHLACEKLTSGNIWAEDFL
jgi:hypothetical protein